MKIKLFDDIVLGSNGGEMQSFILNFNDKFELDKTVHGPCDLRNYGMIIFQNDDYIVSYR